MNNHIKWTISVAWGAAAAFFEQYGILILFVGLAIIFDCITGIIKAISKNEGLSSKKGWHGFHKKLALLVGLIFGIYLDFTLPYLFIKAGLRLDIEISFALIICCYIVLNEAISICENLYEINSDIIPKWIIRLLKGSKESISKR